MGLCVSRPSTYEGNYGHDHTSVSSTQHDEDIPHQEDDFESYSNLPDRARNKFNELSQAIDSRHLQYSAPELLHYAKRVMENAEAGKPDAEITHLDAQNISTLASAYNHAFPALNLKVFNSGSDFLSHVYHNDEEGAYRAIVKLSGNSEHRVAVDLRNHPDQTKTMLVIESATAHTYKNGHAETLPGYIPLRDNIDKYLSNSCKMAVIEVDAQKSHHDCIIFSLNFALAAYQKDHETFNDLHEKLRDNGSCFSSGRHSDYALGMEFIDGTKILPAVFFKHSHSRQTIRDVLKAQPDLSGKNVSTNRSAPHETLSQRVQNFRVEKEGSQYNMSIEASRARKIRKAIENL
ncbi:YopJ family type III secretion system effector XopJ [Erwinia mallotivora]|uniref:YopJ family type III secretion system effector XopJ n=1 Tax=Erwinia mallotivora TaxID=69222 RepID=UPI0021BECE6D|nr:YopJ family type III secretion system effector XopJ [Erwinia mallotivora]